MIYEQVKQRAEQKGITIAEVARQAGISPTSVGKWRKSSPSIENVIRVARVLGCTVDELISDPAEAEEAPVPA